jgi:paraquat-inducible protein A
MKTGDKKSLAKSHPKDSKRLNLMLLSAFILFVVGIFVPILTFKKLFIFSNRVSIVTGLFQLLTEGHPILFGIIFVFSIILPVLKMAVLFRVWNGRFHEWRKQERLLHWIGQYGKWSMLDVFVAALLIVTVRLGAIADVNIHFGLYAFAASVVLTMLATSKVVKITSGASHLAASDRSDPVANKGEGK